MTELEESFGGWIFVRGAWLIPFFPLLGAVLAVIGPKRLRTEAHLPVVAGIALAFLVSLGLLVRGGPDQTTTVMRWLTVSNLEVPIEFRIDGLTTMMLSMVTFVSSLVAVFAAGYMAGDPGYPRFFALIGLFVFSMTGLVLSNNYVLTYVFWEGVGVCSYLLIGFWHTRPQRGGGRDEGVPGQPDRRLRLRDRDLLAVVGRAQPRPELRQRARRVDARRHAASDGRRDLAPLLLGGDGQERPDPALRLAARRDGRPDAGLGPDPRRDDGHGRRLPDRAVDAACSRSPRASCS